MEREKKHRINLFTGMIFKELFFLIDLRSCHGAGWSSLPETGRAHISDGPKTPGTTVAKLSHSSRAERR